MPNGDDDTAARAATRQAVAQAAAVPLPKEEPAPQEQELATQEQPPQEQPPAAQEPVAKQEVETKEEAPAGAGEVEAARANGANADQEEPAADAQVCRWYSDTESLLLQQAAGHSTTMAICRVPPLTTCCLQLLVHL